MIEKGILLCLHCSKQRILLLSTQIQYFGRDANHELSISERKVKYAIDNKIYSFFLTVDEQVKVAEGRSLRHDITNANYTIPRKSKMNRKGFEFENEIRNSDEEQSDDDERNSIVGNYDDYLENETRLLFGFDDDVRPSGGINDHHRAVDTTNLRKNLFGNNDHNITTSSSSLPPNKPLRTINVLDKMVAYLNHCKTNNTGFNEVCASMSKFGKIAQKQSELIQKRGESRAGMLSLSDLRIAVVVDW